MLKNNLDIVIVGGGLLGMMSAYYLAESGLNIALFDQSKLAGESSWAGGGILTPLYPWRYADAINELAFRSQKLYPNLAADLQKLSGIDPQYYNSGMLISREDIDQQATQWLNRHKINYHIAQYDECRNVSGQHQYVSLPEISQIRNPCLASSLASALQSKAIALYDHCAVENIKSVSNNQYALETSKGRFYASRVIVCAGAWSGKILSQLGVSVSVKPVRGQMLLFKTEANLIPSIILAEGKYIIPRMDGHVLVGSTMEDVGFDKRTTKQAFEDLMKFVQSRSPELAKNTLIKQWSGLRPASPKGIPYIFEHPEMKGLFVNTGHFRNGVVLAPASAELLRDLLLGNQPEFDPGAFALSHSTSQINVNSFF